MVCDIMFSSDFAIYEKENTLSIILNQSVWHETNLIGPEALFFPVYEEIDGRVDDQKKIIDAY